MSPTIDIAAGEEIIGVLTAVCARAWKRGRHVVGSSDVLIELSKRIEPFRHAISNEGWALLEERVGRESVDYCGHSQGSVSTGDSAVDCEVVATLREAQWLGRRRIGRDRNQNAPDWCQCIYMVLSRVFQDAASASVKDPQAVHLLLGILGDISSGAHRIMRDLGIDIPAVQRASLSGDMIRTGGSVHAPAYRTLAALGAISMSGSNRSSNALMWAASLLGWAVAKKAGVGAVAFAIGSEAIRQAARSGSSLVRVAHVLVALSAVDYQRSRLGWRYRRAHVEHNNGGGTLARWGLGYPAVGGLVVCRPQESHGEADLRHPWRVEASDPVFDVAVAQVFRQARDLATELKHSRVSSDHLLMCALADDVDGIDLLLNSVGVDVAGLRRDVARQLGVVDN